jgi:hypothetical protein
VVGHGNRLRAHIQSGINRQRFEFAGLFKLGAGKRALLVADFYADKYGSNRHPDFYAYFHADLHGHADVHTRGDTNEYMRMHGVFHSHAHFEPDIDAHVHRYKRASGNADITVVQHNYMGEQRERRRPVYAGP